jgi:ribonuclease HII
MRPESQICSLAHEDQLRARGLRFVAGIDEAGRGPLAGPVVAAAVILPIGYSHGILTDSKKLTARKRDVLFDELTNNPAILWSFSVVEAGEIDRLNILRATHEGMRRAVAGLPTQPDHVLIDGLPVKPFPIPQTALVGGDGLSFSIAAASVIAKVTRDRLMLSLDAQFPCYQFAKHKGYGTAAHLAALKEHGPSPVHRRSFLPVRQAELGI